MGGIISSQAAGIERPDLRQIREREERKRIKAGGSFKRALDEAELTAPTAVELPEGVNAIQRNDSEEGHEDRTEHGFYGPGTPPSKQHRIDVAG